MERIMKKKINLDDLMNTKTKETKPKKKKSQIKSKNKTNKDKENKNIKTTPKEIKEEKIITE